MSREDDIGCLPGIIGIFIGGLVGVLMGRGYGEPRSVRTSEQTTGSYIITKNYAGSETIFQKQEDGTYRNYNSINEQVKKDLLSQPSTRPYQGESK
jgi:hypothetical protein